MSSRFDCCKPLAAQALCVLLGALIVAAEPLHARTMQAEVARIELAVGTLDDVSLTLDWPEEATEGRLAIKVGTLVTPDLGYRYRDLRWSCALQRPAPDHYRCKGALRTGREGKATLAAEWKAGTLELTIGAGRGSFALAFPAAEGDALALHAVRMPAAWLQPLLAAAWEEGTLTAGTVDATLALAAQGDGTRLSGPISFDALGLDTRDGRIAAAGLDGSTTLLVDLLPGETRVRTELALHGGELLAGALYAALPETAVAVEIDARGSDAGWKISRASWKDPGVLELEASADIPRDETTASTLDASIELPALDRASTRYFETLLGTLGLPGLQLTGAASGRMVLRDNSPLEMDLSFDDVAARDGASRFTLAGLAGDLHWTARDASVDSELRWRSAQVYEVVIGAATLPWRSQQRRLGLRAPLEVDLLGGRLRVPHLAWTPAHAAQPDARIDLALSLADLELAAMSRAFGWPAFSGTLSGTIPGVRYADQVLSFDGGLAMTMFDGRVAIDAMSLERPFGVAPTMSADLALEGLDLQPLTGAFGVGEITGRLDGAVRGLRLVDWSPVAFDAELQTSSSYKGPRRISQRAVDDLSRVGGAGAAAGLQTQVLKLFDTFGYSRIGLRCRLANNVCRMGGIDSSAVSSGSYTIVEGSGLPRITIIGHQRTVDWPVLVARMKAATEGQAPIID